MKQLTQGQQLLEQAKDEITDYFGDSELKDFSLITLHAQTLAILELKNQIAK